MIRASHLLVAFLLVTAVSCLVPGSRPAVSSSASSFEPVAFSALRATDNSRKDNGKLELMSTTTDVGFGWNAARSQFECFYPGLYFFTFSGFSGEKDPFRVAIMLNSKETVAAWARENYKQGSISTVLNLNRGDIVFLQKTEGKLHELKQNPRIGFSTFSGFRVSGPV